MLALAIVAVTLLVITLVVRRKLAFRRELAAARDAAYCRNYARCQHTPCDCCGVYCDREATVIVASRGRELGRFCDEDARGYVHDDDEDVTVDRIRPRV